MFEFPKDKCPKCKSEDLKLKRAFYIDDDGKKILLDHYDTHCNSCGWEFILVDL